MHSVYGLALRGVSERWDCSGAETDVWLAEGEGQVPGHGGH